MTGKLHGARLHLVIRDKSNTVAYWLAPGPARRRRSKINASTSTQPGRVAQGLLQHLALNLTARLWQLFRRWLRTMNPTLLPSELAVAPALRSKLPEPL